MKYKFEKSLPFPWSCQEYANGEMTYIVTQAHGGDGLYVFRREEANTHYADAQKYAAACTKYMELLRNEVKDLIDGSCHICRKPAGSCPGCALFDCIETVAAFDRAVKDLRIEEDAR